MNDRGGTWYAPVRPTVHQIAWYAPVRATVHRMVSACTGYGSPNHMVCACTGYGSPNGIRLYEYVILLRIGESRRAYQDVIKQYE